MKTKLALGTAVFVLALAEAAAAPVAAQDCTIRRFGGPNRFSKPIASLAELPAWIDQNRNDIAAVLADVGWAGSPADFFAAATGSKVSESSYAKSTNFQWMAIRRKGQPTAVTGRCWGGARPFEAFSFEVESNGYRYQFAIPKICGNISLLGAERLPPPPPPPANPPLCKISVSCSEGKFVASTAGSSPGVTVVYETPSGKRQSYAGPFEPAEQGNYTFIAEGLRDGLTCRETARHDACAPPKLTCDATVSAAEVGAKDPVTISVRTGPSDRAQSVKLAITRDGKPELEQTLQAPFSYSGSFRKSGSYAVSAVAEGRGERSDACTTSFTVSGPEHRWIVRACGAFGRGEESADQSLPAEQRHLSLDPPRGACASIEYLLRPWLGIELGGLLLKQDAHFVWDTATVWGMDEDKLKLGMLTFGPNFHLTRDRKFDLFVGPLLGVPSYDSNVTWSDQGYTYRYEVDADPGLGAQIGLDVPVCPRGRCFHFSTGLKYIDLQPEFQGPVAIPPRADFELDVNPLIFTVGAGFRF